MDQASKFFILMLLGAFLAGLVVVAFNPRYRQEPILRSNAHYYPHWGSDAKEDGR